MINNPVSKSADIQSNSTGSYNNCFYCFLVRSFKTASCMVNDCNYLLFLFSCSRAGGGNWGAWNHWSLCSKTCDSGWQRRFRMCEGTGIQGYPCDGSGEEVRSCNDKKCPGA